jgi:hypothetical protein
MTVILKAGSIGQPKLSKQVSCFRPCWLGSGDLDKGPNTEGDETGLAYSNRC